MKVILNRKYLLIATILCVLVAFLSRFFLPGDEYKWGVPIICVIASFIISFFIVSFAKKGSKKKAVITRYILAALVVLAAFIYISAWNKIVCTVSIKEIKPDLAENLTLTGKLHTYSKNIITGTELIDQDDPVVNILNTGKQRCTICNVINENDPAKIWTASSIRSSKYKLYGSFLFLAVLVAVLLVYLATEILLRDGREQMQDVVFVSYNHEDHHIVKELCNALLKHDIPLIVDSPKTAKDEHVQNMTVGDDIYSFIKKSVLSSKVTLMVVSESSLLSGWVATETVNTFFLESFDEKKSCIACFVDKSFLDMGFPNRAYARIDQKLEVISTEIKNRIDLKADSRELNDQKTRLLTLRANLDKIIQRLQNSLCAEISSGQLEENMEEIIAAIRLSFHEEA